MRLRRKSFVDAESAVVVRSSGPGASALSLVGIACAGFLLSGCATDTDESHTVGDTVGSTLAETEGWFSEDSTLLVQDVSVLFDLEPEYTADEETSSRWTVLAGCSSGEYLSDSETVEIAVAPTDQIDDEAMARLEDGEYRDAVVCEGREYR